MNVGTVDGARAFAHRVACRRSSIGSMPSLTASSSSAHSTANCACGAPGSTVGRDLRLVDQHVAAPGHAGAARRSSVNIVIAPGQHRRAAEGAGLVLEPGVHRGDGAVGFRADLQPHPCRRAPDPSRGTPPRVSSASSPAGRTCATARRRAARGRPRSCRRSRRRSRWESRARRRCRGRAAARRCERTENGPCVLHQTSTSPPGARGGETGMRLDVALVHHRAASGVLDDHVGLREARHRGRHAGRS